MSLRIPSSYYGYDPYNSVSARLNLVKMDMWDLCNSWGMCKLLAEQYAHFHKEFFVTNHQGCLGWKFGA